MPYGYYQFVRFASAGAFVYFAIESKNAKKESLFFIYLMLALLFQPFIKIALGRTIWNIVDVLVALFLLITLVRKRPTS